MRASCPQCGKSFEPQREAMVLRKHDGLAVSVVISPDGRRIAAGDLDNVVRIYPANPWWEPGEPPPWKRKKELTAETPEPAEKPEAEEQF